MHCRMRVADLLWTASKLESESHVCVACVLVQHMSGEQIPHVCLGATCVATSAAPMSGPLERRQPDALDSDRRLRALAAALGGGRGVVRSFSRRQAEGGRHRHREG